MHCDVGGGYAEKESGLSKIALEWMLEEARTAGLHVDQGRQDEIMGRQPGSTYAPPDPDACIHESLQGYWKLAEWVRRPHYDWKTGQTTKRRNRGRRRTIPTGALLHQSVFARQSGEYARQLSLPDEIVQTGTVLAPRA